MDRGKRYLDEYLKYRRGCGLSEKTVRREEYQLRRFFEWLGALDLREVSIEVIGKFCEELQSQVSQRTGKVLGEGSVKQYLSVLNGWYGYLVLEGGVLRNPLEGVKLSRRGSGVTRGIFSQAEVMELLDGIEITSEEGLRDRALFELMYASGLRVGDVLSLKVEHLNLEERILMVRGKGGKEAYVPFSEVALKFLLLYLKHGRPVLLMRGNEDEVFVGRRGRLSYGYLRNRFVWYLKESRLEGKGYVMHSLRHATATHLLENGASIRYVQELLRHEDLKTTQGYTRPGEEKVKRMYRSYHPRENEYFREVDEEYLKAVMELKERLMWGRKVAEQYRRRGHKRGFRGWRKWKGRRS